MTILCLINRYEPVHVLGLKKFKTAAIISTKVTDMRIIKPIEVHQALHSIRDTENNRAGLYLQCRVEQLRVDQSAPSFVKNSKQEQHSPCYKNSKLSQSRA